MLLLFFIHTKKVKKAISELIFVGHLDFLEIFFRIDWEINWQLLALLQGRNRNGVFFDNIFFMLTLKESSSYIAHNLYIDYIKSIGDWDIEKLVDLISVINWLFKPASFNLKGAKSNPEK